MLLLGAYTLEGALLYRELIALDRGVVLGYGRRHTVCCLTHTYSFLHVYIAQKKVYFSP